MGDAMLGGAPGTAATVAAASILVAEGGTVALRWGAACYALLGALWVLADVARAWWSLRGRLPIVPWRPNLLFRVYPVSKRDLLDRVSRRMDASARVVVGEAAARRKKSRNGHPPRAFGAVVGTCPFAHIGGASLANAALKSQPVKAPLYRAFEPFAGGGIFTAEGETWSARRTEVLDAFASAGLEPLAAASVRNARETVRTMRTMTRGASDAQTESLSSDIEPPSGGNAFTPVSALPLLQRATLRTTFEYLAGVSVADAAAAFPDERDGSTLSARELEDEYLEAATALRHLIPARARSVWMLSDWAYRLSPVGRLETRSVRNARVLPTLAVRAARPGSPLAALAEGRAHGGAGRVEAKANAEPIKKSLWESYMGGGVFASNAGSSRDASARAEKNARGDLRKTRREKIPKALLDEAVTLLFAGHDTQSATLSWALLRLAADSEMQKDLRLGLSRSADVEHELGVEKVCRKSPLGADGTETKTKTKTKTARVAKDVSTHAPTHQPAWRTSAAAPELEAVLRETLRLHPVAPLVVRRLTSDAADGDGFRLPEGTAVGVWLHAVHRDPEFWDQPDAFTPRRWLVDGDGDGGGADDELPQVRRKGSAFMPFAAGPRACVGQHLAWVFMRVMLAQLVCAFEFAPGDERDPMTPSVGFTVTPANGARVKVRSLDERT
jgi:cytochrome P450